VCKQFIGFTVNIQFRVKDVLVTNEDLMDPARRRVYAVGVFSIKRVRSSSWKEFDPREILGPAKEAMGEVVRSKMCLFGSSGVA
jgi:fructose/tagatose bisphosphate aldolase